MGTAPAPPRHPLDALRRSSSQGSPESDSGGSSEAPHRNISAPSAISWCHSQNPLQYVFGKHPNWMLLKWMDVWSWNWKVWLQHGVSPIKMEDELVDCRCLNQGTCKKCHDVPLRDHVLRDWTGNLWGTYGFTIKNIQKYGLLSFFFLSTVWRTKLIYTVHIWPYICNYVLHKYV